MMSEQPEREGTTHSVVEALYDLPLGGSWRSLQESLCRFWSDSHSSVDEDVRLLERHFQRALEFLERLPAQLDRWRNELYRLPVPACVFDSAGEPVDANSAGRRQLGGDADGPLPFPDAARIIIRRAIKGLGERPMVAARVTSASGNDTRLYLRELPETLQGDAPLYLAVIVAHDLPVDGMALLSTQYGLTPSEARLCVQLSSGVSLDELAERAQVKKSTLRTHLANSFGKLGVRSQSELVSLVLHSLFAGAHLSGRSSVAPLLTPHLDPELHGHPKFSTLELDPARQLGYFEYGDRNGIPAFYLHGSLDCGLFMKSQRLMGNGVRLFAVERGGVGESTPNADPSPAAYARDLIKLADHLGLQRYAVIGRSMGSWDAVSLALADPDRVKLLVLASGRLPVASQNDHADHTAFYRALYHSVWRSPTLGRLMLRAMLLQVRARGPQIFMPENGLSRVERELVRDPTYQRHMYAVWMRAALFGPDPVYAHLRLYQDPVPDPPWKGLQTPTLVIHGDQDREVPLERVAADTASFANRQIIVMPDVGHRLVHVALGDIMRRVSDAWIQP